MSTNIVNQVAYLKTSRVFPEESHQLSVEINKCYVDIANAVNARTIGIFPVNRPAITGESWFLTGQRQQTLRQVYSFGAIPPGTNFTIPHGIKNIVQFTAIYGTCVTTTVDYRPLPYIDPITLTTGVALLVNTTDIRIVTGATAVPITQGVVILEWLSPV